MSERFRLLMCSPEYYKVVYVINPWMAGNIDRTDSQTSRKQWDVLHATLSKHAQIEIMDGSDGLPDMVFTANAGLIVENTFIAARFRFRERAGEVAAACQWFADHDFDVAPCPAKAVLRAKVTRCCSRARVGYGAGTGCVPRWGCIRT